jgi:hypothetical protein
MIRGAEAEDGGGCVVSQEVTATTLATTLTKRIMYVE